MKNLSYQQSLGIYPSRVFITAKTDSEVTVPLRLINYSENSISLSLEIKPIIASRRNDGTVEFISSDKYTDKIKQLLKTVKIMPEDNVKIYKLYPKDKLDIKLNFITPREKGDYYFSLLAKSELIEKNTKNATDTLLFINSGVASNIFISLPSLGERKVNINEFKTSVLKTDKNISFNILISNYSPNYININGKLYLINILGKKVNEVSFHDTTILAYSKKYITNSSNSNLKTPEFKIEENAFGLYKARLKISYENKIINKETYFFALPLYALLVLIILLTLIISLIYRVIKKMKFKE